MIGSTFDLPSPPQSLSIWVSVWIRCCQSSTHASSGPLHFQAHLLLGWLHLPQPPPEPLRQGCSQTVGTHFACRQKTQTPGDLLPLGAALTCDSLGLGWGGPGVETGAGHPDWSTPSVPFTRAEPKWPSVGFSWHFTGLVLLPSLVYYPSCSFGPNILC